MESSGKVAVVTGAGSGIGQATACELATRGIKGIAVVDLSPAVKDVASRINDVAGGRPLAEAFVGDVTSPPFRRSVYDQVVQRYGVPGICVPAAGITRDALAVAFGGMFTIKHYWHQMKRALSHSTDRSNSKA